MKVKLKDKLLNRGYEILLEIPELKIIVIKGNVENSARFYVGESDKPKWAYKFKNPESMIEYINEETQKVFKRIESKRIEKLEEKQRNDEALKSIKPGDVFLCSWGYEQTNVNFYKLVSLKGKTGTFVEIGYDHIEETSWCSANVKPDLNFETNNTFKAVIKGDRFKVNSYSNAYKIDPEKTFHKSWGY